MQQTGDYYAVLGIPRDASEAEIRLAFRALAKVLHPDRQQTGGEGPALHDFSTVTAAYETLKDASKRRRYDETLARSRIVLPSAPKQSKTRAFIWGLSLGTVIAAGGFVAGYRSLVPTALENGQKNQESLGQRDRHENSGQAVSSMPLQSAENAAVETVGGIEPHESVRDKFPEEKDARPSEKAAEAAGTSEMSVSPPSSSMETAIAEPEVLPEGGPPEKGVNLLSSGVAVSEITPSPLGDADRTGSRFPQPNGVRLFNSFSDCSGCPKMVAVPPGEIAMTIPSENGIRARTKRIVIHTAFAVSKYEISNEEWRACIRGGGCRPAQLASFLARTDMPATRLSWLDAKDYAQWLSTRTGKRYRLLTEAEWEYAANAGAPPRQPHAFEFIRVSQTGFFSFMRRLWPVTSASPNPWGLHHMLDNADEWVEDCWHDPRLRPGVSIAPTETEGCAFHVVRGGVRLDGNGTVGRARELTEMRSPNLGLRVGRDMTSNPQPPNER